MDLDMELTLEQEFSFRNFTEQVQKMSREQAQDFLILQRKHMMFREMMYQKILKHEWKIDRDFISV